MTKFLKIRYNANGFLKNRIINANDINLIEPFSGPAGRYVDETRSRIFMKDGTKYDMSTSVDEIQKILSAAGALVAEINSSQPVRQVKTVPPQPIPAPLSLYKRSTLIKSDEVQAKPESAEIKPVMAKPASAPAQAPAPAATTVATAKPVATKPVAVKTTPKPVAAPPVLKPVETVRQRAENALAKTMEIAQKTAERVLIKSPPETQRKPAGAAGGRA